jgi:hypothetical protein
MTSPTLEHLIKKYGMVMDAHQVAEAIGMSYVVFLKARHTKHMNIPKMSNRGRKLVTTAIHVSKYLDELHKETF